MAAFLFVLFAIASPLVLGGFRFRVIVSAQGIRCRSSVGRDRFVDWANVEHVSYDKYQQRFTLKARDGYRFRVSTLFPGLGALLDDLARFLDPTVLSNARTGFQAMQREFPDVRIP